MPPATLVFPEEPVFPAGPVLPAAPGVCSAPPPAPPHSPFQVFPAAEPSASSYSQAWWDPAQGAQRTVPASPALAPASKA